jgi:hypothetical protein
MTSIVYHLSRAELLNVARLNAKLGRATHDLTSEADPNDQCRRWRMRPGPEGGSVDCNRC